MPRLLLGTVAALSTVVLATGCTHSAGRPLPLPTVSPGPGSGTIVWLANPTAQTATNDSRQVLVDTFESTYPSIRVELQDAPTNTDSMRKLLEGELSSGQSTPDIYDGDVIWPYEFASRGYALPLSEYLPRSFWTDTFGSLGSSASSSGGANMVADMTYRGAIYGVPEFIDEGFLYYRKDLLKEVGIAGPPQTWQQLAADAMTLKKHGKPYQFVWQGDNYEGLTCDWLEFMADAFGGLPDRASLKSLPADLKSPQARQALDFLRQLIIDGISPANVDTFQELTANSAFDSNQAAFMRGWDSAYADATSLTSMLNASQVGIELPPTFQGQRGPGWSALGGWGLFINPHTKNLTAALTFVKWMAGRQAQWILATQYSEIPANLRVQQDLAVRAINPVLDVAATDTQLVSRPAAEADYPQISQAIHACVNAALPGVSSKGLAAGTALALAARALGVLVSSHPPSPLGAQQPPCAGPPTATG